MSGHSKFANIKHKKEKNDAAKGKIFTKIGKELAVAVKEGGSADPANNSRLRDVIAKAKANNMPNDTIDRNIKKAEGDALRIKGRFDLKNCESFGFMLRAGKKNQGAELVYNVKRGTLSLLGQAIPLEPVDNKIYLDILVDRASVEVFANNGKAALSSVLFSEENDRSYILVNTGGEVVVDELEITPLRSAWVQEE